MMVLSRFLVAAALLLTLGCNPFARRRSPTVPATELPPPPRPAESETPAPQLPEPPEISPEPSVPTVAPTQGSPPLTVEIPPPPEPETPAPPAQPAVTEPPPGPQSVPQLTQLLSPREVALYNREIERNLDGVASLVATIARRPLDDEAALALERVRALAEQAAETRKRDLATARGLAARALMLARDLENKTR